jgi:plasmid stabilization system protein ParE
MPDRLRSKKLNDAFRQAAKRIEANAMTGEKFEDNEAVRFVSVKQTYQMIYEIDKNQITILKIWDARRNPDGLKF